MVNNPLWLNDLIISAVRTIAYMAWAIPIFYLFWPSIISRQRREDLVNQNMNKRTVAGHTLPSGLVSGFIDYDYDSGVTNGYTTTSYLAENQTQRFLN